VKENEKGLRACTKISLATWKQIDPRTDPLIFSEIKQFYLGKSQPEYTLKNIFGCFFVYSILENDPTVMLIL
jgi:hypothetical protein